MTTASRLRHRITIQEKQSTRNKIGGTTTDAWGDVATVWAAVEPIKGKEFFTADQTRAEITHRITLRYRPGITPQMRVLFGSRIFEIKAPPINPDERNREVQLMCTEAVK